MPKWTEFSVTLMIVAMGFALFGVAVKYLPIFPAEETIRVPLADLSREATARTPVLQHAGD
jgi:Ni/Fe-hydrogenase subunit HybB-like protein